MKAIVIFVIAMLYAWVMNSYFGNNWKPASPEEVIADGIVCLLFAIAILAAPEDW